MPPRRPGLVVVRRPRSAALYLRGTIRGHRVYETTGTSDPILAEEARAAREAEIYRGVTHGVAPGVTFAAAALSYLELKPRSPSTRTFLVRLGRHLGPTILCKEVDQVRIDRACRALCRPGSVPATQLRNVITPARAVLLHACRRGWCPAPGFERVEGGTSRTDWLTPAEVERQVAGAAKHLAPLLVFLYSTGARLGEAIALDWRDVDLEHAQLTLRGVKSKPGQVIDRRVSLPPRAVAALAALEHRTGTVFRGRAGRVLRRTQQSRSVPYGGQIKRSWADSVAAAKIDKAVTPHHTRHTWASWHYAVHKDLLLLKRDGCWSSVSQVERYAHLVPAGYVEAIRRFWGLSAILVGKRRDKPTKLVHTRDDGEAKAS